MSATTKTNKRGNQKQQQQQQQDDNEILYTQMLNQQDDSLVENSAFRLELLRSESQNVAVDVAGCQRQQMQKQTSSSSENAGLMNEDKEQLINYIVLSSALGYQPQVIQRP